MKTAISLPDELYRTAERTAQDLGIPRSQLFARALEEFIRNHQKEGLTERLNEVYSSLPPGETSLAAEAGLESLRGLTKDDSW